eukprot:COSAG01_NODE_52081_length_349_cov_1.020000_1_plen_24_part_01
MAQIVRKKSRELRQSVGAPERPRQ